jgi:hypothetical protein
VPFQNILNVRIFTIAVYYYGLLFSGNEALYRILHFLACFLFLFPYASREISVLPDNTIYVFLLMVFVLSLSKLT